VAGLDRGDELIGRRFVRAEPRARAGVCVRGLLAGLQRKNGWTLAEHAGAVFPDRMQRLLRTADWDIEGARNDVRGYVLDHLTDPAPGVFVVDETGFVEKGPRSAEVQRQYVTVRSVTPSSNSTVAAACRASCSGRSGTRTRRGPPRPVGQPGVWIVSRDRRVGGESGVRDQRDGN